MAVVICSTRYLVSRSLFGVIDEHVGDRSERMERGHVYVAMRFGQGQTFKWSSCCDDASLATGKSKNGEFYIVISVGVEGCQRRRKILPSSKIAI